MLLIIQTMRMPCSYVRYAIYSGEIWDLGFIESNSQLWATGITLDYLKITIDSGVQNETGSHADSLKDNILRDNSSKPSIKDYAVKYSKQSQSRSRRNRRPVILCCCRWTKYMSLHICCEPKLQYTGSI